MKSKMVFILLGLSIISCELLSQSQFGPRQTDYRRDLIKYLDTPVQSSGLFDLNSFITVGRENYFTQRGVYQWNISDLDIPDNSEINKVRLTFNYAGEQTMQFPAAFYNISYDMISTEYYDEIWNEMHYTITHIGYENSDNSPLVFESNDPNNLFNQAIRNSLPNNKFVMGLKWSQDHTPYNYLYIVDNISLTLYVEFTPPDAEVIVDQKLSTGQRIGRIKKWDNAWSQELDPPLNYDLPVSTTQVFLGDQREYNNQKYNTWNNDLDVINPHEFIILPGTNYFNSYFKPNNYNIVIENSFEKASGLNSGEIKFRDPWLRDYFDPLYELTRNRGEAAQFIQKTSPINFSNLTFSNYMGVFLNQGLPLWAPPYYSVHAISPQNIAVHGQNRNFHFYEWAGTGVQYNHPDLLQTDIVFTASDAAAEAVFKGERMSNMTEGLYSNSQRKIARTDNGVYHMAYTSMDKGWYTYSLTTDFEGTWAPEEVISYNNLRNPFIAAYGNNFHITYEEMDPVLGECYIYYCFQGGSPVQISTMDNELFGSSYPVLCVNENEVVVIYKKSVDEGLYFRTSMDDFTSENSIPNTGSSSKNPSVSKMMNYDNIFHICWEESDQIKYMSSRRRTDTREFLNYSTPSSGSGFTQNRYPSVVGFVTGARITWLGSRLTWDPEMQRFYIENKVVFKDPGYYRFWNFGTNTNAPSINGNYSGETLTNYIYSWSENTTDYPVKYGNTTLSAVYNANQNGKDVQMIDGIGTMVLNSHSGLPYLLELKDLPVMKTDILSVNKGREGIIYKDTCQFYFLAGDISVNGNAVNFIEFPDTASISSLEEMNNYLVTEPFSVGRNSLFTFSLKGGILDSLDAGHLLTNGWVRFKVQLVDNSTNTLLGEFSSKEYNTENYEISFSGSYKVNTNNLDNRTVRLKLQFSTNIEASYAIADVISDQPLLQKMASEEVRFEGDGIITEYSLFQNFPNPFNPVTQINYQIPKDGKVILTIYDILGNELRTLVDEYKTTGRYTVEFNANSLASGIYIYRIQAGEYTASRKMTLIK